MVKVEIGKTLTHLHEQNSQSETDVIIFDTTQPADSSTGLPPVKAAVKHRRSVQSKDSTAQRSSGKAATTVQRQTQDKGKKLAETNSKEKKKTTQHSPHTRFSIHGSAGYCASCWFGASSSTNVKIKINTMATSLTIVRQNGNVAKSLDGQDHVSGFIAYLLQADIPAAFANGQVQAVSTIDKAEELGIKADADKWSIKMLHYQLEEIFRINDGISLFVGLFSKPEQMTFAEVATVQNYAEGAIRQMAI